MTAVSTNCATTPYVMLLFEVKPERYFERQAPIPAPYVMLLFEDKPEKDVEGNDPYACFELK